MQMVYSLAPGEINPVELEIEIHNDKLKLKVCSLHRGEFAYADPTGLITWLPLYICSQFLWLHSLSFPLRTDPSPPHDWHH